MTSTAQEKSSLACYNSKQIDYVWDLVAPHIQRALDRGSNYCLDDVYEGLTNASMQLWVWQDTKIHAAMVTAIQTKNNTKFCLLLAIGGDRLEEWAGHLPVVEQWARDMGCDEMRIYGRIGWARALNYDVIHTRMGKKLWAADQIT